MADLREVIKRSWLELDARVAPLRAREATLKAELRSVQQELDKLMNHVSDAEKAAAALGLDLTIPDKSKESVTLKNVPIKQAIRLVLSATKDGLTSSELHRSVSDLYFNGNLDRTSFSPQLSRMRAAGEVDLIETYWTLTPAGRESLESYTSASVREAQASNFIRYYEQHRLPIGDDALADNTETE
ncbi:hypothetical protein [Methylobacterium sp. CM6244]